MSPVKKKKGGKPKIEKPDSKALEKAANGKGGQDRRNDFSNDRIVRLVREALALSPEDAELLNTKLTQGVYQKFWAFVIRQHAENVPKPAVSEGHVEKAISGLSQENVKKLKNELTEIANKSPNEKLRELAKKKLELRDLLDDDYDHVEEGLTPEQQKELNGQLLKAVREGNLDKVKEAYHKGADPAAVDEEGKSVWHHAEEGGHNEIIVFFDGIDAVYQRCVGRMLGKIFSRSQYKVDKARVDVLTDEVLKNLRGKRDTEPENGS